MVRLTNRPDMTLDVYRGRKTTIQQRFVKSGSRLHKIIITNHYFMNREGLLVQCLHVYGLQQYGL